MVEAERRRARAEGGQCKRFFNNGGAGLECAQSDRHPLFKLSSNYRYSPGTVFTHTVWNI